MVLDKFVVDDEHNNMRFDKFIRKYSKLEKLSEIFNIIKNADIKVNGKKKKENYRLVLNDVIEYNEKTKVSLNIENKKSFLLKEINRFKSMIIYEDKDIFIINKTDDIPMHKGNLHKYGLSEIAKSYYNNNNVNFANRLDLKTSGLVIGAKNLFILRKINDEIKNKRVKKKYIAIINSKNLKLGDEFENKNPINFQEAHTKFRVINILNDKAILDVDLLTGRKHQIRIHLSELKRPIIGDDKYGGKKSNKMYLKCYFLEFLGKKFEIDNNF